MTNITENNEQARKKMNCYQKLSQGGFSLIRLSGKRPIEIDWTQYCEKHRTYDEIGFQPGDNAGIACGPVSNVIVIDVDVPYSIFASAIISSPY